jgi:four helix bundle protein
MSENIIKDKSFAFAIRIVKLCQHLQSKNEFVLSKQILRSGTSIGAMVQEAEYGESKDDFNHKLAIAQKKVSETIYWLELLTKIDYLTQAEFDSINENAVELIKLITSIIKSAKNNQQSVINH